VRREHNKEADRLVKAALDRSATDPAERRIECDDQPPGSR
jgi:hypothetical protein